MNGPINLKDIITTAGQSNQEDLLGKMVYYSLSDVLMERAEFEKIRAACNIGCRAGTRISSANAFRAATGDVKGRVEIGGYSGKVYFRDNKQRKGWISRELVMEEPDDHTNLYTKVANVVFNRNTETLCLENVSGASPVNAQDFYAQVCNLYEKYRRCVNRRQVETVATNMLAEMNAITKVHLLSTVCLWSTMKNSVRR